MVIIKITFAILGHSATFEMQYGFSQLGGSNLIDLLQPECLGSVDYSDFSSCMFASIGCSFGLQPDEFYPLFYFANEHQCTLSDGFDYLVANTTPCNDCQTADDYRNHYFQGLISQFESSYDITLSSEIRTEIRNNVIVCGEGGFEEEAWLTIVDIITDGILGSSEVDELVDFIKSKEDKQSALDYLDLIAKLKHEDSAIRYDRAVELYNQLLSNPNYFVNDCVPGSINPQDYADLFNHQLPQECNDVLGSLGSDFEYQSLDDAHSPSINFDHYSVEITIRPDINGDNQPDSNEEILEAIQQNFLMLASGSYQGFVSECPLGGNTDISWDFVDYPGLQPSSSQQWNGPSPIGTIFLIDAGASGFIPNIVSDLGAVIVSDYQDCCWVFSTIVTGESGSQPFSGHRQFGIRTTPNGLEFFTRAADRAKLSPMMKLLLNDACSYQDYFNIGDITWTNLMNNVKSMAEANGGAASVTSAEFIRPKYLDVITYMKSSSPIPINCD